MLDDITAAYLFAQVRRTEIHGTDAQRRLRSCCFDTDSHYTTTTTTAGNIVRIINHICDPAA